MRMKIELTPSEVCSAIKDYVRKEYGKEVDEVSLTVRNEWVGYGPGEHQEPRFIKAIATIN